MIEAVNDVCESCHNDVQNNIGSAPQTDTSPMIEIILRVFIKQPDNTYTCNRLRYHPISILKNINNAPIR